MRSAGLRRHPESEPVLRPCNRCPDGRGHSDEDLLSIDEDTRQIDTGGVGARQRAAGRVDGIRNPSTRGQRHDASAGPRCLRRARRAPWSVSAMPPRRPPLETSVAQRRPPALAMQSIRPRRSRPAPAHQRLRARNAGRTTRRSAGSERRGQRVRREHGRRRSVDRCEAAHAHPKDAPTYGEPVVNGNGTRVVIEPARCPAGPCGGNHSLEARLSSLDIIGIRL